jgi:type I restriction enzyme S subunit
MNTATTHIKTEKQLVPALRFKEFEGDIEETLFGNHYSFHTTNSLSRDKLNYDKGEVRNIHYGDIHTKFQTHFYLTNEYVPFVNEDLDLSKIKEDSYCKVGDVVIADASEDYADIGKSIELIDINNEKLLAGLHTFLARPSSESTAVGYISCLLKSWKLRKQIMTIAQGTKVLSLSTGRVSKLKLNLPSLPEQQKIASFLSAVDEKIQQLSKKKALLEQYKKGGLQQLFSGQLRFKDENGNPYPDWEEKRLGDISDKVNKKNKDNSVNYVLTNSATQGIVSQSDYFDRDIANQNNLEGYYVVEVNDFVYNPRISVHAPVGPVKRNKLKEGVMSPLYTVFRFKDVDLIYLECFFSTIVWHKYLNSVANFGARHDRMNISQQDFFKMPIPFPCFEEQQKIARYLSSIDTKIEAVNNQITQTQTFKKGLLQQMFV